MPPGARVVAVFQRDGQLCPKLGETAQSKLCDSAGRDYRRRHVEETPRFQRRTFPALQVAQREAQIEISSRLIPLVDRLTHILIEAGKDSFSNKNHVWSIHGNV
jgi:hypothetical protein